MDGMTADVYEPVTHVNMDEVISRSANCFILSFILLYYRLQTQHNYEQLENSYRRTVEELQTERTRVIELENKISDLQDNRSFISFSRFVVYFIVHRVLRQSESSPSDPCPSPSPSLPPVCPPAVPPPPPPPSSGQLKATGILPNNEPMKKVPKPNGTLKTLNWTVIPRERIPGTLWENIDEEKLYKQASLSSVVFVIISLLAGLGRAGDQFCGR
jgi:dishevelled associated activator of morphogenesis